MSRNAKRVLTSHAVPPSPAAAGWALTKHAVQFYETDEYLCRTVTAFLSAGLQEGEPILVVGTPEHRVEFAARLQADGFDVQPLGRTGLATFADARETLDAFIRDGMPDEGLFAAAVMDLMRDTAPTSLFRAYGEMVDVLWREDNPRAAVRLEELWNELAETHAFKLLCAYSIRNFSSERHAQQFEAICRRHTHVIPTEGFLQLADEDARSREVTRLQQRAGALDAEICRRAELEKSLREALAERRRAEEALRQRDAERDHLLAVAQQARQQAEETNRLKDEFLAILSHELRTPLNAILGWAHLGADPSTDEAIRRRALKVIERNAALQAHLVDDLLEVARVITGKLHLDIRPVDLAGVLRAALEIVRPASLAKAIDLELAVPDSPVFVLGDAARLQQVFWHLLSNAIKFTPPEGVVAVRVTQSDSGVRVLVEDTGEGIPTEFLPHVWEPFRQADASATRPHSGLGLGLSVVKHLVEAHGGQVAVTSRGSGLGAALAVTLRRPPVGTP